MTETPLATNRITIRTLLEFLIGDRDAILQIAQSRRALWLGLVFVLSAGFAREYDGEYLLREPWHLLIPVGASMLSAFVLHLLLMCVRRIRGAKDIEFGLDYRRLLTLFWMTAPLAWLYGIPFERFMSAPDAVAMNLALLGVVSVWRVTLSIQFVSVLYHARWFAAFIIVLLFADAVAIVAISAIPQPIVSIMGGIRHTESEQLILAVTCSIQVLGILVLPVFLIAPITIALMRSPSQTASWRSIFDQQQHNASVAAGLWVLAGISLLVWIPLLPGPQAEQRNRWLVTRDLQDGRIEEAVRYMSERTPDDFPPHWDPPPRPGYGERNPPFHEVLDAIILTGAADWVQDIYVEKLGFQWSRRPGRLLVIEELSDDQLRRYRDLLIRLPEGPEIAASHSYDLDDLLREPSPDDIDAPPDLSDERRELLESIREIAEQE